MPLETIMWKNNKLQVCFQFNPTFLFKAPNFLQLSQWTGPMLSVQKSLVNLLNIFKVMYHLTYIITHYFSLLLNAFPDLRLKDLKTYKHKKFGFWKGQQHNVCLILNTSKRYLGKELPNITCNWKDRGGEPVFISY